MSITIGIPFYNAEKYLGDAIRSVFAQTYQNWELILIDDGSTDGSLEIAKTVNDPRVRIYSDGKNKKLASRLNEIVQLASYDIIARMDADDLMSPTRLEKQLEILNKYPDIDLVSSGLYSVTNNLEPIGVRWHHSNNISFKDLLYRKGCGVVHAAILGRKSWFMRNQYNTSLKIAQDYELWVRTSFNKDFKVYLIQEPLYYYREESSITRDKILLAYKYDRRVFRKYGGKYKINLLLNSIMKSGIIYMLFSVNKMNILLKKRSLYVMDELLFDKLKNELKVILKIKLNGSEI